VELREKLRETPWFFLHIHQIKMKIDFREQAGNEFLPRNAEITILDEDFMELTVALHSA